VQYDGNHGNRIRLWHDPVIFPVIGPSVLSAANQNARVMTQ